MLIDRGLITEYEKSEKARLSPTGDQNLPLVFGCTKVHIKVNTQVV